MVDNHLFGFFENFGRKGREDEDPALCFAQTFSSVCGKKVLEHLERMTVGRVLGPDASDAALRCLEGQRQLIATIRTLIEQGQRKTIL